MATGKGELVAFPIRPVDDVTGSASSASSVRSSTGEGGSETLPRTTTLGVPKALTRVVPLSYLGSETIILKRPLYSTIEESATGQFVAATYDLDLAGQGDTEFAAIADLREQLLELFLALRDMKDSLPDHLRGRLAFLESLVD